MLYHVTLKESVFDIEGEEDGGSDEAAIETVKVPEEVPPPFSPKSISGHSESFWFKKIWVGPKT